MKMLITGGTGSLGSRLVPHFLEKGYKITVLSRDEDKQSRMMLEHPSVRFVLGDIRDYRTCLNATKNQDIVIHAAALKRIEFGEVNIWEFIQTNLIGTKNVVYACKENKVKKMLFISTDKACKPINVYGMCKALGEKIVVSLGYNCVRYGNVNDSRGSVLPYWRKLAEECREIPVTNSKMTRFLMEFEQSIRLIEIALVKMNGAIHVPKLEAANIYEIAKLFSDNPKIIGERLGEKMHEELISYDELRGRVEEMSDHFVIHMERRFPRIDKEYTSDNVKLLKGNELKRRLIAYLPKF